MHVTFVRDACRISEILQTFRAIFAQNLRDVDAGLASYLSLKRISARKRNTMKFYGSCNHAGKAHATSVRAARQFFSGTSQFFRASWAEKLRDPDAGRVPFRIWMQRGLGELSVTLYSMCSARWLSARKFLCARRSGFLEILQTFCPIFAQILRDLNAGLARHLI